MIPNEVLAALVRTEKKEQLRLLELVGAYGPKHVVTREQEEKYAMAHALRYLYELRRKDGP